MDILMPENEWLGGNPGGSESWNACSPPVDIPRIVALTAEAHPRRPCSLPCRQEWDDYITKPFKHEELLKILNFE